MRPLESHQRAVTVQIGAILMFGIAVLALSAYQAVAVPAENKQVEFNHNQQIQQDMLELRSAVLSTATGTTSRSVAVQLGETYPPRVLLVNPPPGSGRLATAPARNVSLGNVTATDPETDDFLNTTANGPYNLSTRAVSYSPDHSEYHSAPTPVVEIGATVNENPRGNDTVLSDQTVVEENEITLVTVTGDLSAARTGSVAVKPESLSTSTQATTVTSNSTNRNITITIPTTLSVERWQTLLNEEYDPKFNDPDHHVHSVSDVPGRDAVEFELDGGVTYRLRTAQVGVGSVGSEPDPAYLTRVEPGSGDDVTLAVRDRFNNPVPNSETNQNLTVNVSTGRGQVADEGGLKTVGEDGRVVFDVTAPSGVINFTLQNTSQPLSTANRSVNTSVAALGEVNGDGGDDGTNNEGGFIDGSQSNCVANVTTNSDGSNSVLSFDVANSPSCDPITIEAVGVAYDSNGGNVFGKLDQDIGNKDQRQGEIVISGSGEGSFDGGGPGQGNGNGNGNSQTVSIDGSYNTLESFATVSTGGESNVGLGYVTDDDGDETGDFEYTDVTTGEDNRPTGTKYFTVKLKFSDGSVTKVYLDATNT